MKKCEYMIPKSKKNKSKSKMLGEQRIMRLRKGKKVTS